MSNVIVIGAGVIGLSCAYKLVRKKVRARPWLWSGRRKEASGRSSPMTSRRPD